MRILIVGPTGPAGRRLVRRLGEEGHDLVLYTSHAERLGLGPDAKAEVVAGEVTDRLALRDAAENCEVCLHLAAHRPEDYTVAKADVPDLFRLNVQGTQNVVDACLDAGVPRLVAASTHLTGPPHDPDRLTPYLMSRTLAEAEVWRGGAKGLEVCVVAPALVIGADEGVFRQLLIDLSLSRVRLYPADTKLDVVALDDLVTALRATLTHGDFGTRYLLRGGRLGWQQLADMVGLTCGWPVVLRAVGERTASLAARVDASVLSRLRRRAPVATPERTWALTHSDGSDPSVATTALGFEYADVELAVRQQLDHLVAQRVIGGD